MTPESAAAPRQPPSSSVGRPVPPEPTTIEDTGLSYEALRQLLTKALLRRRGKRPRAGREALPAVRAARVAARPPAGREADRGAWRGRVGTAGFRYALPTWPRARDAAFEANGYVGPAPVPLHQVHGRDAQAEGGARLPDEGTHRRGLHAPGREPADARPARPGGQLGQVDLPLRPSRQRQDGRRRRHRPRAGRRHVRAVGARHRRPDHHHLRPGQPHARSTTRRRGQRDPRGGRATGAGCASGGRSSPSAAS